VADHPRISLGTPRLIPDAQEALEILDRQM
jgi:hypothetical protein